MALFSPVFRISFILGMTLSLLFYSMPINDQKALGWKTIEQSLSITLLELLKSVSAGFAITYISVQTYTLFDFDISNILELIFMGLLFHVYAKVDWRHKWPNSQIALLKVRASSGLYTPLKFVVRIFITGRILCRGS
jgi:hypothetical protein